MAWERRWGAAGTGAFLRGNNRGGVLLGVVAAMVIAGVLGAGAASMLGTTSFHGVRANYGERAYYLAESGFRYAASTFRRDGKAALVALPLNSPYEVPGGGRFTIIGRTIKDGGENIFTVAAEQTIQQGGDMTIVGAAADISPRNSAFEIGGKLYRYLRYNSAANTLENVVGLGHQDFPVTFPSGTAARTVDSAELVFRGEYPGTGSLNVARNVTYWWPLSGGSGGAPGEGELVESSMENFGAGPGGGGGAPLGIYDSVVEGGALAIQLQGMNPGNQHPMTSLQYAGGSDSSDYEVQVKVKIKGDLEPVAYMAGISFRFQGDGNNPGQLGQGLYGVSFAKGASGASGNDAPPASLTTGTGNAPIVVLWKLAGNPQNIQPTRLAWSSLAGTSMVDGNGRLKDWSTLLVRVLQADARNRITVMYGDHVLLSLAGDANAYNDGVRKSSPRGGIDDPPRLPWPPDDIAQWTAAGDYFTVVSAITGYEDNSFLYNENAVAEVGLHTWGQNLVVCTGQGARQTCDGKIFFDDFGLRLVGQGGGSGHIPPIQQ